VAFTSNDSKYGDDDLDSGSIDPFRLFLIFNELVDAESSGVANLKLSHMLDQSHNVTDPIESLMTSAIELTRAYAQALLVDRKALVGYQETNDALVAAQTLKHAFTTGVHPILARAGTQGGSHRSGGHLWTQRLSRGMHPAVGGSRNGVV
jgi:L-rhamnose isomerase/sugar isomerase